VYAFFRARFFINRDFWSSGPHPFCPFPPPPSYYPPLPCRTPFPNGNLTSLKKSKQVTLFLGRFSLSPSSPPPQELFLTCSESFLCGRGSWPFPFFPLLLPPLRCFSRDLIFPLAAPSTHSFSPSGSFFEILHGASPISLSNPGWPRPPRSPFIRFFASAVVWFDLTDLAFPPCPCSFDTLSSFLTPFFSVSRFRFSF